MLTLHFFTWKLFFLHSTHKTHGKLTLTLTTTKDQSTSPTLFFSPSVCWTLLCLVLSSLKSFPALVKRQERTQQTQKSTTHPTLSSPSLHSLPLSITATAGEGGWLLLTWPRPHWGHVTAIPSGWGGILQPHPSFRESECRTLWTRQALKPCVIK